jgi:hypothetical protein
MIDRSALLLYSAVLQLTEFANKEDFWMAFASVSNVKNSPLCFGGTILAGRK